MVFMVFIVVVLFICCIFFLEKSEWEEREEREERFKAWLVNQEHVMMSEAPPKPVKGVEEGVDKEKEIFVNHDETPLSPIFSKMELE